MAARVVSFLRRTVTRDWSSQDLAEFYRVEAALLQAGLRVSSERGVTDEGDPWFVFCRVDDDDEVIIHFARIDGRYLISMPGYGDTITGMDFQTLVRELVERHPVLRPPERAGKVVLHPAALLVLLVASALLQPGHAEAAEHQVAAPPGDAARDSGQAARTVHDTHQEAAILAAIGYVAAPVSVDLAVWAVQPAADAAPGGAGFAHAAPLPAPGPDPAPPPSGNFTPDHATAPVLVPVAETHDSPPAAWSSPMDLHSTGVVATANPADPGHVLTDSVQIHTVPFPVADLPAVTDMPMLPHTTALGVLFSLPGSDTISFPAALPPELSTALQGSVHMSASSTPASPAPAGGTANQAGAPAVLDPGAHPVPSPAANPGAAMPASHADTAAMLSAASAGTLPSPAPSVPAPVSPVVSLDGVLADLKAFSTSVAHPAVAVAISQVIVYDAAAVAHMPAQVVADTFDFPDGSSISLVGLPSELAHLPVHA